MNKKIIAGAAAAGAVIAGLPFRMDVSRTEVPAKGIKKLTRICVISDLHSSTFGKHQEKLIKAVKTGNPDLILMPGDIVDDLKKPDPAYELAELLRDYPCYYVEGNHEMRLSRKEREKRKQALRDRGVIVLEDEEVILNERGIDLVGMHCMPHHPDCRPEEISSLFHGDGFRILISHRPCFPEFYEQVDCDLVVCGHAHGGQWRIPFTKQGLYAPQEGIFPKYTEGLIRLGRNRMFVSRGLNRDAYYIPRLYNNPELCFLDLVEDIH